MSFARFRVSRFSIIIQQDAEEYWGHLLELMSRAEHAAGDRLPGARDAPTTRLFTYGTEDRIQCSETGRVGAGPCVVFADSVAHAVVRVSPSALQLLAIPLRCPTLACHPFHTIHLLPPKQVAYKQGVSTSLGLLIPMEAAENKSEVQQYEVI